MIKEYNNLLNTNYFDELNSLVTDPNFAWHLNKNTSHNDGNFMFTHVLYNDEAGVNSNYYESFLPLIIKAGIAIGQSTLLRAKLNLYGRTSEIIHHPDHVDMKLSHKGAVFSLNTCDGGTVIDGEKFDSVANRILFFDPSKPHHSTSTTDVKRRLNVNINYI